MTLIYMEATSVPTVLGPEKVYGFRTLPYSTTRECFVFAPRYLGAGQIVKVAARGREAKPVRIVNIAKIEGNNAWYRFENVEV